MNEDAFGVISDLIGKIAVPVIVTICVALFTGCDSERDRYQEYKTRTDLFFPIIGESLILVGGRKESQNPFHYPWSDQRFAIDIAALEPGAKSPNFSSFMTGENPPKLTNIINKLTTGDLALYRGNDFENNDEHYCFGRLVVAPGRGLVIDSKDGIHDNVPGIPNEKEIPGNYVVIDHLNGEYSMLAHFKQGSLLVTNGDKVEIGDPLGLCGNSGNSYIPHLHYHLQNTPRWLDGDGLPAQFQNYTANGSVISRGEPVQGELITTACFGATCQ